jgi:hypothetical protein
LSIPSNVDCFMSMIKGVLPLAAWGAPLQMGRRHPPLLTPMVGIPDTRVGTKPNMPFGPARRCRHGALTLGQRTFLFQIRRLSAGRAEETLPDVAAGERGGDRGPVGLGCGELDVAAMRLGDKAGTVSSQPRAESLALSDVFLEEPVSD